MSDNQITTNENEQPKGKSKATETPITVGKRGAIRFEGKSFYARVWVRVSELPQNGERVQLRYFTSKDN